MGQLHVQRQAELKCPADQAWEYMTDLRRALTIDQFHMGIECSAADATNPKTGLIVPIIHKIFGQEGIWNGRITKFSDYELSWGESTPQGVYDPFPHSEGWQFEEINSTSCLVTMWLKGQWRTPIGSRIQDFLMNAVIAPDLDRDLVELSRKVGAELARPMEFPPNVSGDLYALAMAETINGIPAEEFFAQTPPLYTLKNEALSPT